MIGNIRWNIGLGLCGMLATLLFSSVNNPLPTVFRGGLYSFMILFAACYLLRWLLGTLAGFGAANDKDEVPIKSGQHIDWSTPDDAESVFEAGGAVQRLSSQATDAEQEPAFEPIRPPRLATKEGVSKEGVSKEGVRSDQMAEALRKLSDE